MPHKELFARDSQSRLIHSESELALEEMSEDQLRQAVKELVSELDAVRTAADGRGSMENELIRRGSDLQEMVQRQSRELAFYWNFVQQMGEAFNIGPTRDSFQNPDVEWRNYAMKVTRLVRPAYNREQIAA